MLAAKKLILAVALLSPLACVGYVVRNFDLFHDVDVETNIHSRTEAARLLGNYRLRLPKNADYVRGTLTDGFGQSIELEFTARRALTTNEAIADMIEDTSRIKKKTQLGVGHVVLSLDAGKLFLQSTGNELHLTFTND